MLSTSFFTSDGGVGTKRTPYSVRCTPYASLENPRKIYVKVKNLKIRLIVPINLIFSKTVSSLFALKNINNYLRIRQTETGKFDPWCLFFSGILGEESTEYGVRSTEYAIFRGVK